jgi:hypothetical protein
MKHLVYILYLCLFSLCGCVVSTDHHYPKIPSEASETMEPGDISNPLTPAELEHVKLEIDQLQPYMQLKECIATLGIPRREIPTSVWGPAGSESLSMQLRDGHVLLIVRDNRGYVISAQLDEKKWVWPNYKKP